MRGKFGSGDIVVYYTTTSEQSFATIRFVFQGDYGGPLVHVDAGAPTDITKMKLVGVASWGNGCGVTNYPGGKKCILDHP